MPFHDRRRGASLVALLALALLAACSKAAPENPDTDRAGDPTESDTDSPGPGGSGTGTGASGSGTGTGSGGSEPTFRNVYILVVDTLRYDRMSVYGNPRSTTPNLEAAGDHLVKLDNLFAVSNWTLPTVTSVLTGLVPYKHGALDGGAQNGIDLDVPLLATEVAASGIDLAMFPYNGIVDDKIVSPFLGWELPPTGGFGSGVEATMSWIDEGHPDGFVVWNQPVYVHWPYLPPESVRGTFADYDNLPFDLEDQVDVVAEYPKLGEEEQAPILAALLDLYDECVYHMDRQFQLVLDGLEARGLLEETLVVVTADHGEMFDDNDSDLMYHTASLHPGVNRVPLLIYNPRLEGGTWSDLMSQTDLLPALVRAIGGPDVAGGDTVPVDLPFAAPAPRTRSLDDLVFAVDAPDGRGRGRAVAYTDGAWKVEIFRDTGAVTVYDLVHDHGQTTPLGVDASPRAQAIHDRLIADLPTMQGDCVAP